MWTSARCVAIRRLLGVWLAGMFIAAGKADDLAKVMPADTAVYIGWSRWVAADSPELRFAERMKDAAAGLIAAEGEEQAKFAGALLDALPGLQTGSAALGLFDLVESEGQIQVHLAVVAGPDARPDKLNAAVSTLLEALGDTPKSTPVTLGGATFQKLSPPGAWLELVWGTYKGHFIFGLHEAAVTRVIACLDGAAPTLADNAELKFDRERLQVNADGRHIAVFVNFERVVSRGVEFAREVLGGLPANIDALLAETGFSALKSKYVHLDEAGGTARIQAFAHVTGPMNGILKIWDQAPLTDDDLKLVPQDAYWAQVGNLDLAGLWREILRVIEVLAPDQAPAVEGALAMAQQMLGFSITEGLLPAFGDTWALLDAPAHGGVLLTGTVLVAEVKDPTALQGMLARIVEMITPFARENNVTLTLRQARHGNHDVHYVLIGGVPSPVAPAWGYVGGRWVFGLFPQTVAAALRQVDPQTRGPSLLDHPDFKAARAQLPKEVNGLGYADSRYLARLFYPFLNALQTMGVSMLGPHGGEIDFAIMPPVTEHVKDVRNAVSGITREADGVRYASIGDGTPVAVVAATGGLAASVLVPSLAQARQQSRAIVSMSNLRGLGAAVHVYANDHDEKFPAKLEDLLESGMVTPNMLRAPQDPDPEGTSYIYITGQGMGADPRNAVAYERFVSDGKINVLFLDGHVERMDVPRAHAAIRETYTRLGRPGEVPPEMRSDAPAEDAARDVEPV